MDNYNGINQFEINQMNQINQNQYMQPNPGQYQQMPPNHFDGNNTKTKRRWVKWLFIIGIPVVAITVVLLFILLRTEYNIDDTRTFMSACRKALDTSTKKIELEEEVKEIYGYKSCYGTMTLGGPTVRLYEFESEDAAESYFNYEKFALRRWSRGGSIIPCDIKFKDNYVEFTEATDDEKVVLQKTILIIKDEYVLYMKITGDKKEVERRKEEFLEEITN